MNRRVFTPGRARAVACLGVASLAVVVLCGCHQSQSPSGAGTHGTLPSVADTSNPQSLLSPVASGAAASGGATALAPVAASTATSTSTPDRHPQTVPADGTPPEHTPRTNDPSPTDTASATVALGGHAPTPRYTKWAALNDAIVKIPHLNPALVTWKIENKGAWAATDLNTGTVYVSPTAPVSKLYSIVAHEYGHVLQGVAYGDYSAAVRALAGWYGTAATNPLALERAADCMALLDGVTWTRYTTCRNTHWRDGARYLLNGHRLPYT